MYRIALNIYFRLVQLMLQKRQLIQELIVWAKQAAEIVV